MVYAEKYRLEKTSKAGDRVNSSPTASPLYDQRAGHRGSSIVGTDSLDSLIANFSPLPKNRKRSDFTLLLPQLSKEECASWEARLKHYYFACGCMEGSLASLGALIGYAAYLWLRSTRFSVGWADALYALGLFVAFGMAGKMVGLIFSHKRLERAIAELKIEIQRRMALTTARGNAT